MSRKRLNRIGTYVEHSYFSMQLSAPIALPDRHVESTPVSRRNDVFTAVPAKRLAAIMADTAARLDQSGLTGEASLFLEWHTDAQRQWLERQLSLAPDRPRSTVLRLIIRHSIALAQSRKLTFVHIGWERPKLGRTQIRSGMNLIVRYAPKAGRSAPAGGREAAGGHEHSTQHQSAEAFRSRDLSIRAATPTLRPARLGTLKRTDVPITCAASDKVSR